VAVLVLFFLDTLVALADYSALWEHDLVSFDGASIVLSMLAVLQPPQLDYSLVGRKQLKTALVGVVQEFEGVYFLIQLHTFEVVKLRLV